MNKLKQVKCKICESNSFLFGDAKILNKYDIKYYQCSICGFIQTEEPYWLAEAYLKPIATGDSGLVRRNIVLASLTSQIISAFFDQTSQFLDYGGGYGIFVRMMRDLGFKFYWHDEYCENLFAKEFEVDLKNSNPINELITAFELFEHFKDPVEEIEKILRFSKSILFSTELLPSDNPKPSEWWYYAPQDGQHISIYTYQSLSVLANKLNLNIYSNGKSIHLLTKKELSSESFNNLSSFYESTILQQELRRIIVKSSPSQVFFASLPFSETTKSLYSLVIVDGVFFQLYKTGIARVWKSLLEKWAESEFAQHVVVLDRAGTAPKIPGIRYREVSPYDYSNTEADRAMLQQICDEEGADLFISTYYTTPLTTPSVFMAYDMIPEVAGADLTQPMWREKHRAIQHASSYLAISENTARDLVRFFPDISPELITVAHCGVQPQFSPASSEEISRFKTKYGVTKPYFILAGAGSGQKGSYKNTMLFFQAFSRLFSNQGFDIVCTGGGSIDEEVRAYTAGSTVHTLTLEDAELRIAYSGAVALVYPSKYEGFGLPVLEALACGCPVITCPNASIPEVAGEAALYVQDQDVNGMANALCEIQKPEVRNSLVVAGLEQAKKFSWAKMADQVSSVLIDTTLQVLNLRETNLIIFPDWSQPEEALLLELQEAIRTVATHPDKGQITLLIDTSGISAEDADMAVSSVAMNLMMESDLDVSEGPEISLVPQLSEAQWQALLPRLQGRIRLECENLETITESGAGELAAIALNSLSDATNLF